MSVSPNWRKPLPPPPLFAQFANGGGRGFILLAAVALIVGARPTLAHWEQPEAVIAQLRAPALQQAFGISAAARAPDLARLLVIRVGPQWFQKPAAERRDAAERWWQQWRHAVPQGITAILDETTGQSLVSFDAHGRAAVKEPHQPTPAAR